MGKSGGEHESPIVQEPGLDLGEDLSDAALGIPRLLEDDGAGPLGDQRPAQVG